MLAVYPTWRREKYRYFSRRFSWDVKFFRPRLDYQTNTVGALVAKTEY
ncbi:hypothetical protein X772_05280 [Mesorhizobium sp. LSJC280B00]|nr:hypothetical protein X772_05280 [Mesorhizobium sp. LSJC280B00]